MTYKLFALLIFSFLATESTLKADHSVASLALNTKNEAHTVCKSFYDQLEAGCYTLPNYESFELAFEGYETFKCAGKIKNELLTIVDFSLSSTKERMWVIDMAQHKIILQSLVSHGMNSGKEFAHSFSNEINSFKSSLGFYLTGETYIGQHGLSLKLDGQEYGVNDKARARAVVIHGASYVNHQLAKSQGYIGRSQGCPAVPEAITKTLIETIKNHSVLYIHHSSRTEQLRKELTS